MFPLPPLGPEQRGLVDAVSALSRERFAGRAARYDSAAAFPTENYADLHQAGLLGLVVPREYGGRGADPLTYAVCLLEIARGCGATALTFNMHSNVLTFIDALGTPAQKRHYFGEVVERGRLFASITSEPESSFRDKFVLQTVFRPAEGGYHVSGLKHFCSLGDAADYYFLSGVLEGSASARDGLLSAVINRGDPGVKVEGTWNAMGMRGTISHSIRYETFVGADQVIGGRPGSWTSISPASPWAMPRPTSASARPPSTSSSSSRAPRPSSRPRCRSRTIRSPSARSPRWERPSGPRACSSGRRRRSRPPATAPPPPWR